MKTLKLLILASNFAFFSISFGQTGPGGVGNSSTLPFWIDAHTMGGANGTQIGTLTDFSGNNNDAVQATSAMQPTYTTGAINGRNAIVFSGGQSMLAGAEPNLDNAQFFQMYMCGQINNSSILSIPFNLDYGTLTADNVFSGFYTQSGNFRFFGHRNASLSTASFATSSGVNCYMGEYDIAANDLRAERNFTQEGFKHDPPLRNTSTHESIWIGGGSSGYYSHSTIGDAFIYTTTLNSAEQKIVENYISAKYGISISTDLYSFETIHGLGVIGIGQDDASNNHIDSQGNGVVRINSPSDLNDGEYLFIGHDDTQLTSFNLTTNVPDALPGSSRFLRQWRVEKTGDLGTVTLIFDLDPTTNFSPDPNNYRLLIDSDADMSGTISQTLTGTYNAGDETVTFTNVSLTSGDFFTLAGDTPTEIHSIASGNWGSTATWDCGCIPTSFNNVFIDPGHTVTVDEDANANSFSIDDPTSTLQMDQNFTLHIYGDFDNSGTLNATDGTISMVGASDQHIDAAGGVMSFYNLNINNSGSSNIDLLSAEYHISGTLDIDAGTLTVDNSGSGILVIDSDGATTGGRIGVLATGTQIIGNVRVERNIPAGNADWRDLCSPVKNVDFNQWDPDIFMSGIDFPDGCAYGNGGCYHSVRFYKGDIEGQIASSDTLIMNGRGFKLFIGDDLVSFSGATLKSEGTVNTPGSIVKTYPTGWNTAGNPYASPITFNTVDRTSQIGNYYYIYDSNTGDYQWYDGSSNTSSVPEITSDGLLAIGQGFWIYTTSQGSLTYDQLDKSGNTATYIRNNETDQAIYVSLKEDGTTYKSMISFELNDNATSDYDSLFDIRQLSTGLEISSKIGIVSNEGLLAKNYFAFDNSTKYYDTDINIKRAGIYKIELENAETFMGYNKIYVFDKLENKLVDLRSEGNYIFQSDTGHFERFSIVFTNDLNVDETGVETASTIDFEEGIEISQMGSLVNIDSDQNIENVQITLYNTLGQVVHVFNQTNLNAGSNVINVPTGTSGVRILSINNNGKLITKKLVF